MQNANTFRARVSKLLVQNSGKIAAATGAAAAVTQNAAAMDTSAINNGTALFAAGVGVAQTEPLGTIISMFAVGIAGLFFIYMVKRLK